MTQINVGTAENPIYVPEAAANQEHPQFAEWWELLGTGSVGLNEEQLAAVLQYLKQDEIR